MAQHTAGPWKAAGGSVLAAGGEPVAIVAAKAYPHVGEVGHANARLIAAAPDLLAALESLLAAYPEPRGKDEFLSPRRDKAWAAVAKARGEDR